MVKQQLLMFEEYQAPAQNLANRLGCQCDLVSSHRFPDGEGRLCLPAINESHVLVCRSLNNPDQKLIELLLTAQTLRNNGVERLTLVAPYLCYMRQDKAFHPGEVVSQQIIGRFLADLFDDVVTVDPHLHRVSALSDAVPAQRAVSLHATRLMRQFLQNRVDKPLLLGPDEESVQWVTEIAGELFDYAVATKIRTGDRQVEITLPVMPWKGRDVVLVDDVISTGHTVAQTARQLKTLGVGRVYCLVTHALFASGAEQLLAEAGVDQVWSTDSLLHDSNALELAPLLAESIADL